MGTDWIIGRQALSETLSSGRHIEKVFVAEGVQKKTIADILKQLEDQKISYQWVPRSKLDQLADGGNHQGIAAQIAAYEYSTVERILKRAQKKGEMPFLLLLDGIEDPHNLGSILRSADAAGVHGVVIPKRRAVGLTSVVAKTSAGAIEYVPVAQVTNLNRVADELKKEGIWLVGTDGAAKQSYNQVNFDMPVALVIGNEGQGISQLMKKKCDYLVRLPMKGRVSSLNASVAAGICMYQVALGRNNG
ncbi:23S rRNA (guanosine(2251)-2'-O)-methyltransferase RlmB [Baia soyae]|uniref:23S rRNA (Guanosine2251-2'-O)-methyltransferase n=1 Tax=Baia soyae TaxID=1544746 RepID=A0A4R2RWE1_9BACL|nr:23S rRNA (guanosine(2251)-2'-O)-methyltransferase RlmB [Baia soyae]TCP68772.1 23S rRNA (guanosine2251-2'-O)-methyltransferase [Baia soyae]